MRHAFLIIAHNNWWQLKQLIQLLDAENHDIYVHIDKKSKSFSEKDFSNLTSEAKVYFFQEYEVFWGGFSQVQVELFLFEKAYQQKYDYYHLISGADLPLKSNLEIDAFFEKNQGKEFMGALADSVLAAGGEVTGVEPEFFVKGELQHDGLTELIVTKDMTERKTKMIELGDAFIAFPGGTGTLEEIAEVMSKVSLKHLDAPCILYDLDGYYTGLRMLLSHMIETGLSSEERQEGIYFAKDLAEIKAILNR